MTEQNTTTVTLAELGKCSSHLHVVIHGLETLQQDCLENEDEGKTDTTEVSFACLTLLLNHLRAVEAILAEHQHIALADGTIPPHIHAAAQDKHVVFMGGNK